MKTASVLARGYFRSDHAKTAHGLIRHGKRYKVVEVVDESLAGEDAGSFLGMGKLGIPVVSDIGNADVLIIGIAPPGGALPVEWRKDIRLAIEKGMDIIAGMHQFLSQDKELAALATKHHVRLQDIRKPPANLDIARGYKATSPVLLFHGTDSAVGKRTTTLEFLKSARRKGINAGFVATGQTGIMIGCNAGIAVDALPADFVSGALESMVKKVDRKRDLILVEGQGSLFHTAYGQVALGILLGAKPDLCIITHDPSRKIRKSFIEPIPKIEEEINAVERLGNTKVVGVALNCKNVKNWPKVVKDYEERLGLPVVDVLRQSADKLVNTVMKELSCTR